MNARLLTSAALLFVSSAALADKTFERTVQAGDRPDLYISTGSGTIRVFPGSGNEIHIKGHVHAGWNASGDVEGRVQRIADNPPVKQNGNTIHVGETNERSLYNNVSIDYEVTAPRDVALNLRTGSGDIEVDHLGRFLAAESGSGSVRAHGLHGPAELGTGSGDIELEQEAAGNVRAKTGSGSIRVHGMDGALQARAGSGDIEVNGRLVGPGNLSSGSGSIRLHLTPDSRFNLTAATGSGNVRASLPGAQNVSGERHHLTAAINGGGPALDVHTGSGDIDVTPGGLPQ